MSDSHQVKQNELWGMIGHQWAVGFLRQSLASGNLSHAYLFTGPQDVGKMTLALSLAAALLCQGEGEPPCNACRACRLVANMGHPDVHIVESRHVGDALRIDQVRGLQRQLVLTPVEGNWRIAILRRFEEATPSAANALLKTLEEPPPYVVIAVLTDDPDRLPATVVSRCQRVPLRPLSVATVRQALKEHWHIDPEQAELLAHLSAGRLEWAVGALDDTSLLEHRVRSIDDMERLLGAPITDRFRYANDLAGDQLAAQRTIDTWTSWWRDVLLFAAESNASPTNVDQLSSLQDYASRYGVRQCAASVKALRRATERLSHNANVRLTLEVLMLDLPTNEEDGARGSAL